MITVDHDLVQIRDQFRDSFRSELSLDYDRGMMTSIISSSGSSNSNSNGSSSSSSSSSNSIRGMITVDHDLVQIRDQFRESFRSELSLDYDRGMRTA